MIKQHQLNQLIGFLLLFLSANTLFAQSLNQQIPAYYGPVQSGETLWKIARQIRPDVNLSYYQVMLGLLKANPSSFQSPCNLNTLKIGSMLRIPSVQDMQLNNHAKASQAFSQQVEAWEMFTKYKIPINCEVPPSNNETTETHAKTAAAATQLKPEDALSHHNTQTASELVPPSSPATPNDKLPTPPQLAATDEKLNPMPDAQTEQGIIAAFRQLTAKAFWTALSQGNAVQPGASALVFLVIAFFSFSLLAFWLNRRNCNPPLKQTITTPEKEHTLADIDKQETNRETNKETPSTAAEIRKQEQQIQASVIAERPLGWFLAVVVPLALFFWMQQQENLTQNVILFLAIVSVPLIMWMFSLLPDFVPALFVVLLCLLFGLAPAEVVLSGFSSNGFLLTFSVLGLGVVITSSGLTYRYTLLLLKWLPEHTAWYQFALFFTGVLFTPVVPSIAGRAAISAPILLNMTQGLDPKTKKQSAGMLYSGGLDGVSFVSAIFLTSAPANLIIFGMLPQQEQQAFQFMYWLYAASLTGAIMLVLYLIVSAIYFRAYRSVEVSKADITKELKQMGAMSWREWWALAGIFVLAIGIVTASTHKIKIPFVAFSVFFVLLFLGVLSRDEFIKKIDWAFLFLLGCLIGVLATMNYLEIDKLLLLNLSVLGDYMRHDFHTFVIILSIAILGVRFFIPINSTILIFSTALLPISSASGVSPWLIGFIILLMAETSFFNYQSPHILYFRRVGKGDLEFNEWSITFFKALLVIVKLVAIYASIPFWLSIGVL